MEVERMIVSFTIFIAPSAVSDCKSPILPGSCRLVRGSGTG
jgi:hypothetical protein